MRALALLLSAIGAWAVLGAVHAQPMIPATFYGTASVDGKPPPLDTPVRGLINGKDCTQPGAHGTVLDGGVGAYVISVMHESQEQGCGKEGRTVTFTVDGRPAGQTAEWKAGPIHVDLNVGSGSPVVLPTDTPPPAAGTAGAGAASAPAGTAAPGSSATPGPGTPLPAPSSLPTDDVKLPLTPRPPGSGTPAAARGDGGGDGGGGIPTWGIALIVLAFVAMAGGAGGYWLSRRERRPPEPPAPP